MIGKRLKNSSCILMVRLDWTSINYMDRIEYKKVNYQVPKNLKAHSKAKRVLSYFLVFFLISSKISVIFSLYSFSDFSFSSNLSKITLL